VQLASIVLAALKLISALVDYLRERKLINAAQDATIAQIAATLAKTKEQADAAREDQRRRNRNVAPADGLPDDGFRRD
jgi:hypothetical protein